MSGRPWKRVHTLKEAIASFLETSGLGRRTLQDRLGLAWTEVLGVEAALHTRISRTIRRGVMLVEVDSPALLSELGGFRKAELLSALRERVKDLWIEDIRFRLNAGF